MKYDCGTPRAMSTTSSITAHTAVAGWSERWRPRLRLPSRLRASSAGVWIAPAATTTRGASTVSRPPAAVEHSTPRPIFRAVTPV